MWVFYIQSFVNNVEFYNCFREIILIHYISLVVRVTFSTLFLFYLSYLPISPNPWILCFSLELSLSTPIHPNFGLFYSSHWFTLPSFQRLITFWQTWKRSGKWTIEIWYISELGPGKDSSGVDWEQRARCPRVGRVRQ